MADKERAAVTAGHRFGGERGFQLRLGDRLPLDLIEKGERQRRILRQGEGLGRAEGDLACRQRVNDRSGQGGKGQPLIDPGLAGGEGQRDIGHRRALGRHCTEGADFIRRGQGFTRGIFGIGPDGGFLGILGDAHRDGDRGGGFGLGGDLLQCPQAASARDDLDAAFLCAQACKVLDQSEAGDTGCQRVDMGVRDALARIEVREREGVERHQFDAARVGEDRVLLGHGEVSLSLWVGCGAYRAVAAQEDDGRGRAGEGPQKTLRASLRRCRVTTSRNRPRSIRPAFRPAPKRRSPGRRCGSRQPVRPGTGGRRKSRPRTGAGCRR